MSHPYEYHNFVLYEIQKVATSLTVLDAGCGLGIWGYLLRSSRRRNFTLIGLDIAPSYLSFVREKRVYDTLVRGEVSYLPFRDKAFDCVLAVEVIEHLPKDQGKKMLSELERCCRGKIILTTPNGFKQQTNNEMPTETHRSGWTVRELRSAGFRVRGIGSRVFGLDRGDIVLSSVLHFITTPFAQVIPSLGEYLIATKCVDQRRQ